MVGRVLETLRELGGGAEPPPRPNQLRREEARTERLRRQPAAGRPGTNRPTGGPEERAVPRPARDEPPADGQRKQHPLVADLATPSGLRRAWLAMEILGPPRGLRSPGRETESRFG